MIIGNWIGTILNRPDWLQGDETKPDFIKNKPDISGMISTAKDQAVEQAVSDANGYTDSKRKVFASTIPASGWSSSAPYTNTVTIGGVLATDYPHVAPVFATNRGTAIAQREAWNMICSGTAGSNSITFKALEDKPGVDISIQIEVIR